MYAVERGAIVKILPQSICLQVGAAPVPALDDHDDVCSKPDRTETKHNMDNDGVHREETLHLSETTPKTVDDGTS